MSLAIFVIIAVCAWLVRSRRGATQRVPLEGARPLLEGLALMIDGAFLVIEDPRTGRFVQLYKDRGDGRDVSLVFDLPKVDTNVEVFEWAVEELRSRHPNLEQVTEQNGAGESLESVQIVLEGAPSKAAGSAFDLVRLALTCLKAEGGEYIMTLDGERDLHARAHASKDGLERVSEMRIPVVSRLARRTLRQISEE